MKDYFLRAASREQIDQALINAGLLSVIEGEPIVNTNVIIDYVGAIYRETGAMAKDADGSVYPAVAPVEGYHVNLRGALTPEQEAILPVIEAPNNPQRIFAGGIL